MPATFDPHGVNKHESSKNFNIGEKRRISYKYPNKLKLKPDSEFHKELRENIFMRANDAYNAMSRRFSDWDVATDILQAYVPPEQRIFYEKAKGNKNAADPKPRLVLPVSYANIETIVTYLATAFLQSPIFRFEGVGPEDIFGASLLETVVDVQCRQAKVGLNLMTQWRDGLAYGVGISVPKWKTIVGPRIVKQDFGFFSEFVQRHVRTNRERRLIEDGIIWEGNVLENVDPYMFLPDPSVSAGNIQKAEYVGWITRTSYPELLAMEEASNGEIFNVRYLEDEDGYSTLTNHLRDRDSKLRNRSTKPNNANLTTPIDVIWMYVDLIPDGWKLGDRVSPQKWLFGLAGDNIIIAAKPANHIHGLFPVTVAAPDYDGYSPNPASRFTLVQDLQDLIDFMYTAHVTNVRKALNDMFVVDPSLINIFDVNNPAPGKVIRMRRKAWGKRKPLDGIEQLKVTDVTSGMVQEVGVIQELMKTVMGAPDNIQGSVGRRGPRVSSAEIKGARGSSLARLEKTAKVLSMQQMQPLAQMMATNIQQMMQEDTFVKIVGEIPEEMQALVEKERLKVSPLDMVINYDLLPGDGTIPGSADVDTLMELFTIISADPELRQGFNLTNLFKDIARHAGAKNIGDFVRVVPDGQVEQQVQQGNLVPAGGQV